jgi:hypothetical protein
MSGNTARGAHRVERLARSQARRIAEVGSGVIIPGEGRGSAEYYRRGRGESHGRLSASETLDRLGGIARREKKYRGGRALTASSGSLASRRAASETLDRLFCIWRWEALAWRRQASISKQASSKPSWICKGRGGQEGMSGLDNGGDWGVSDTEGRRPWLAGGRPVLALLVPPPTCSSTDWPLDWTSTVLAGAPSMLSARRKETMSALSMT